MNKSILLCLANGSEEIEAVTTFNLLVRAGIEVNTASVNNDSELTIVGSRGMRIIADFLLKDIAEQSFDAIILPGGITGAKCFRDSILLIEFIRRMQLENKLVAAICATPALVFTHHKLFSEANMTSFPALKKYIPSECWIDQRVVYDKRYRLITSQGPGTAIDFALCIIRLISNQSIANKVAEQLIIPNGIINC